MRKRVLALLPAALLATGCSTVLKVTYVSDPPGAALYQGAQMVGYAPLTLEYPVTEEDKRAGVKRLQGTSVKWASGASASVDVLTADLRLLGMEQSFTFQRPNSFPGRDIDMRFALELERLNLQRQAQQQQANAEANRAFWEALRASTPAPRRTVNCVSTTIGNMVTTNCN
jgi:hypothetical protein